PRPGGGIAEKSAAIVPVAPSRRPPRSPAWMPNPPGCNRWACRLIYERTSAPTTLMCAGTSRASCPDCDAARWTMPTLTADHAPRSTQTLDALAAEIAAMQVIANALSDIHDREARQRVLSWALERFTAPSPPPQVVYATAPWPLGDDPTLSCEGLEEFFE